MRTIREKSNPSQPLPSYELTQISNLTLIQLLLPSGLKSNKMIPYKTIKFEGFWSERYDQSKGIDILYTIMSYLDLSIPHFSMIGGA